MTNEMQMLKAEFNYDPYFYAEFPNEDSMEWFIPYRYAFEVYIQILNLRKKFTFNAYISLSQNDIEIMVVLEHVSLKERVT